MSNDEHIYLHGYVTRIPIFEIKIFQIQIQILFNYFKKYIFSCQNNIRSKGCKVNAKVDILKFDCKCSLLIRNNTANLTFESLKIRFTLFLRWFFFHVKKAYFRSKDKDVLSTLDDWLHQHCHFVWSESFTDINKKWQCNNVGQRSAKVLTKVKSRNFTKFLSTFFQLCLDLTTANMLVFCGTLSLWGYQTLKRFRHR